MKNNKYGAIAQLGERLVRNEEVRSSILLSSTNQTALLNRKALIFCFIIHKNKYILNINYYFVSGF